MTTYNTIAMLFFGLGSIGLLAMFILILFREQNKDAQESGMKYLQLFFVAAAVAHYLAT